MTGLLSLRAFRPGCKAAEHRASIRRNPGPHRLELDLTPLCGREIELELAVHPGPNEQPQLRLGAVE